MAGCRLLDSLRLLPAPFTLDLHVLWFTVKRSKSTNTLSNVELVWLQTEGEEGPQGRRVYPANPSLGNLGVSIEVPAPLGIPTPSSFPLQTKNRDVKCATVANFQGPALTFSLGLSLSKSQSLIFHFYF